MRRKIGGTEEIRNCWRKLGALIAMGRLKMKGHVVKPCRLKGGETQVFTTHHSPCTPRRNVSYSGILQDSKDLQKEVMLLAWKIIGMHVPMHKLAGNHTHPPFRPMCAPARTQTNRGKVVTTLLETKWAQCPDQSEDWTVTAGYFFNTSWGRPRTKNIWGVQGRSCQNKGYAINLLPLYYASMYWLLHDEAFFPPYCNT